MASDCTVAIDNGYINIRVGAIIMKGEKFLMVGNQKKNQNLIFVIISLLIILLVYLFIISLLSIKLEPSSIRIISKFSNPIVWFNKELINLANKLLATENVNLEELKKFL